MDLSNLSDVVKHDVSKKAEYDKLDAKVNSIDTIGFVLKTKYDTDKSEIEGKIPDVSNLSTKTALTTVENKIPYVSSLVRKTGYTTKVREIENQLNNHNHDSFITTLEFNTLAANVFNARLAKANLVANLVLLH